MKKIFLIAVCCLLSAWVVAQSTPVTPFDQSGTFSGSLSVEAPYEIFAPYQGLGPVVVYNTAQVDFTAGERIHLQPGFIAGNFNGSGYFHAQIGAAPDFDVVFVEPNESYPSVGQYEKLELGLKFDSVIEAQIDSFVHNGDGINPFDPDQISVEATFSQGSQSYTVYGFYYEEYIRNPNVMAPCNNPNWYCFVAEWFDMNTPYHWRIRFAPPTTGQWHVKIDLHLGGNPISSASVDNILFECVPSSNHGFLEVGADGWHLRHTDHTSFFGIGQDIAWPDASQFRGDVYPNNPAATLGGYLDILDWMTDLSQKGGNMTRVVNVPWSYEYEWEHLNNYSERMPRAWELDTLFENAEQNNLEIVFCFVHGTFTDQGNNEGDLNWQNNPYNTQVPNVTFTDDFLTSQTCSDIFKKKLRYFMSRWGYSTSLGIFQLLSEMEHWTFRDHYGFPNDPDLKYNVGAQQALLAWHNEMLSYAKEQVSYRQLLTSTSYGAPPRDYANDNSFYSPYVDIVCPRHCYSTERDDNMSRYKEMNDDGLSPGVHSSQLFENKPALTDEMGFHNGGADPNDMEYCSDINYHNAIWATSFNGGLNSGLYWWQWFNNDHRSNFTALNTFFSDVDWESERFTEPGHWEDALLAGNVSIETFYLASEVSGHNRVMGWVHNASYYWGNIWPGSCADRDGNTTPIDGATHDDTFTVPTELPDGTQFEIHGLNNLASYTVDFYSTRGNGGLYSSRNYTTNIFGTLKPDWIAGEGDWAFKAYRPGNNFRITQSPDVNDTLGCAPQTITVEGNYILDSLNNFTYHWDFGNGQSCDQKETIFTYSTPGTFLVTLIVAGPDDLHDTLQQTVVVRNCENTRGSLFISGNESEDSLRVDISPNPSGGIFSIETYGLGTLDVINVYAVTGELILSRNPGTKSTQIDITGMASGVYYVHIWNGNSLTVKRIIKE